MQHIFLTKIFLYLLRKMIRFFSRCTQTQENFCILWLPQYKHDIECNNFCRYYIYIHLHTFHQELILRYSRKGFVVKAFERVSTRGYWPVEGTDREGGWWSGKNRGIFAFERKWRGLEVQRVLTVLAASSSDSCPAYAGRKQKQISLEILIS